MSLPNPSQAHTLTNIPPSDFKDLMDVALRLYTDSLHFLQNNDYFSKPYKNNSNAPSDKCCMKERQISMARVLINRYDDLDRHYGWVLAGDQACVDQALGGICEIEKQPCKWLKELVKELEGLRGTLEELQLSGYKNEAGLAGIQARLV